MSLKQKIILTKFCLAFLQLYESVLIFTVIVPTPEIYIC